MYPQKTKKIRGRIASNRITLSKGLDYHLKKRWGKNTKLEKGGAINKT